ncbi:MAG TPA: hypothetical protein VFW78_03940 [Bacteroidia bacterium]|nr:hypothetical protein [Bacteroidia bacterium]
MEYVNITEFNCLNMDEKAWYLWHGATFLSVFEKAGYRINLFHLNDYYIELWYNISENKVDHIRAFRSLDLLDPFLATIDIESLFWKGLSN